MARRGWSTPGLGWGHRANRGRLSLDWNAWGPGTVRWGSLQGVRVGRWLAESLCESATGRPAGRALDRHRERLVPLWGREVHQLDETKRVGRGQYQRVGGGPGRRDMGWDEHWIEPWSERHIRNRREESGAGRGSGPHLGGRSEREHLGFDGKPGSEALGERGIRPGHRLAGKPVASAI